jgi:hypothetical protein
MDGALGAGGLVFFERALVNALHRVFKQLLAFPA